MRHLIRWIVAAALLTFLYARGSLSPPPTVVLSSLLGAGVLTLGLAWSDADWKQAFIAVFIFEFIVGTVNTVDEGVIFHVLQGKMALTVFAGTTLVSALLALVLSLVPPMRRRSSPPRQFPPKLWARVPLVACAYVLLYLTAGSLVWPYVKSFYQSRPLPGLEVLLPIEWVRGLIFVVGAWPWLPLLRSRGRAILFLGAAYSILGGIAPLLLPNPLMPGPIRLAHGFEVGISDFIFGALVGWTLAAQSKVAPAALDQTNAKRVL